MKKLAVSLLFVFLALSTSQAKTTSVERVLVYQQRTVLANRTVTKNVLAHAIPRAQRRLLVTNVTDDENDDPPGPDELDLQSPYRRPRVSTSVHHADSINDYVGVRLAVARARAMEKYRETFG